MASGVNTLPSSDKKFLFALCATSRRFGEIGGSEFDANLNALGAGRH
jgi:hypothetical protein